MSILRPTFCFSLVAALLLVTAHRLPAPISEVESPTPAPEQSAKPKPKPSARTKRKTEGDEASVKKSGAKIIESARTEPSPARARFAGTWKGKMSDGGQWTIVIDPAETKATAIGGMWGAEDGPAQIDQNTISWNHTINKWSLTLMPDEKTAKVVEHHAFGINSGVLQRTN
jgi:hypothetical protein